MPVANPSILMGRAQLGETQPPTLGLHWGVVSDGRPPPLPPDSLHGRLSLKAVGLMAIVLVVLILAMMLIRLTSAGAFVGLGLTRKVGSAAKREKAGNSGRLVQTPISPWEEAGRRMQVPTDATDDDRPDDDRPRDEDQQRPRNT